MHSWLTRRRLAILGAVIGVVGVMVWWRWPSTEAQRQDASAVTPSAQARGSGSSAGAASATPVSARATISVTDDHGVIAGALVRLAPDDGEVIVVRSGVDGIAHADKLVPGQWSISASASGHEPGALPDQQLDGGADVKLSLVLATGGRALSGRVTDATGGPIEGARIDAAKLGVTLFPSAAVATALTGRDGGYQLAVAHGQLMVAASSTDYAPQSRYVEVGAAGATADFALVPGGVIEGVVLDERTRSPVAGADIEAIHDNGAMRLAAAPTSRAVAGPDGRFRITGLRPGGYALGGYEGARYSKIPTAIHLGVAEQVTDVELLIAAGAVMRGVVVDEHGAPVPGIAVTAWGPDSSGSANAGENGAFVIDGVPPGRYRVTASDDAFMSAGSTEVELTNADRDGLKLQVIRGIKLTGHVEPRQICEIDPAAIEGVDLWPQTTAADGSFGFGPMQATSGVLSARCASGARGSASIKVAAGMAEITLKVTPGAAIAGQVVDPAGKPVAGVTVAATPDTPASKLTLINGVPTSAARAITTSTGGYEVIGLAPGSLSMTVIDRSRPLRMPGKPVRVTIGATEHKQGVVLVVDRPDGVIDGVITGPDTRPLADAWVSVRHPPMSKEGEPAPEGTTVDGSTVMIMNSGEDGNGGVGDPPPALTDAMGRFRVAGLRRAPYDVIADGQAGKLRGQLRNVTPDKTVSIQAVGVSSLSGTVRGLRGPAEMFAIELDGPTEVSRTFTNGTYLLRGVMAGSYKVGVTSTEGNAELTVTVKPGQPTTLDVTLVPNAVLVGTLVDSAGKPMGGVNGFVVQPSFGRLSARPGLTPSTASDGTFRIEAKAGEATLVFFTEPTTQRSDLVLEAGKTLDLGTIRAATKPPAE